LSEKIKNKKNDTKKSLEAAQIQVLTLKELRQQLNDKLKRYQLGLTTLFVVLIGLSTALIGSFVDLVIGRGLWTGIC
jgi:hypothetical protein